MCVCVCGVLIQSELLTSPGSKQVMEIISAFCFGAERIESSQISVNSHTWIQSAYYILIQQFHFVAHLCQVLSPRQQLVLQIVNIQVILTDMLMLTPLHHLESQSFISG